MAGRTLGTLAALTAIVIAIGWADRTLARECPDGILDPGEECDDSNSVGGDGCARNCTRESERDFVIDPTRSSATTQLQDLAFTIPLEGFIRFTTGGPSANGQIPFVVRPQDAYFPPIRVPPLLCACVRTFELPPDFEYAPNVAGGNIGCGPDGLFASHFLYMRDHSIGTVDQCLGGDNHGLDCNTDANCPGGECLDGEDCVRMMGTVEGPTSPHPRTCNGPNEVGFGGGASARGTMAFADRVSFALLFDGGTCCTVGVDPGCADPGGVKGPDGIPCTDDDLDKGTPTNVPGTTGLGQVAVVDADNVPGRIIADGETCGAAPCVGSAAGLPFNCDAILANPSGGLEDGVITLGLVVLHNSGFGDSNVTITLAAKRSCPGDCNRDETVSVDELVTGVQRSLGNVAATACAASDRDNNGAVDVGELVMAVNSAVEGCPE